jgi:hypothetical protein
MAEFRGMLKEIFLACFIPVKMTVHINYICVKIQFLLHREHSVSIMQTSCFMPSREIHYFIVRIITTLKLYCFLMLQQLVQILQSFKQLWYCWTAFEYSH